MIIGLTGHKGSGKNLFATLLQQQFPKDTIKQIAFADPIKATIIEQFQLVDEAEYDIFKRGEVTFTGRNGVNKIHGRDVVRNLGMRMRHQDEEFFNNVVRDSIMEDPSAVWIITDVRFENEVDLIREMGGLLIRLVCPTTGRDGHISEGLSCEVDFVLENQGVSRHEFSKAASELYCKIKELH